MKNRLNITVDATVIKEIKHYAYKHQVTVSQLVEQYFRTLVRPSSKKNILELLDELPYPDMKTEGISKQAYYNQRKGKYGF